MQRQTTRLNCHSQNPIYHIRNLHHLLIDWSQFTTNKNPDPITSQADLNLLSAKQIQLCASSRKTLEFHWKHVVSSRSPVCPTIKPLDICSGRINRRQLSSKPAFAQVFSTAKQETVLKYCS
jgi:hypothetical protein